MIDLKKLLPLSAPLHHAYLVTGEPLVLISEIKKYLNERFGSDYAASGNPDFWETILPTWGIEESRTLKEASARRPVSFPAKVFVISANTVTLEAQNSLLKTLEEPVPNTHFFIVAKQAGLFLPTVISRCQVIDFPRAALLTVGRAALGDLSDRVSKFLRADIAERLKMVKNILKEQENDQGAGVNFLNELASAYWQKVRTDMTADKQRGAEILTESAQLASQRGGSLRLLLEHVAGVVPIV